jgi:hypothetical protein
VFDALTRGLVLDFRRILPPGWSIGGSARSDIHLRVPQSQSESDFQIRPGWITAQPGSGRARLRQVMLERFQAAVTEIVGESWPAAVDGRPAPAFARSSPIGTTRVCVSAMAITTAPCCAWQSTTSSST